MKTFVKIFSATESLSTLVDGINAHLKHHPKLEIVSVSHSVAVNGSTSFLFTALVVFKELATV